MKIELDGYSLYWDGFIELDSDKIEDAILSGVDPSKIVASKITKDIERFNRLSSTKIKSHHDIDPSAFNFDWDIPDEYKKIDVKKHFRSLVDCSNLDRKADREQRLEIELKYYVDRGYQDLLRTLIYIVDTFKKKNVVWGVGRGSSCASYLLYLVGIHSVDPIKYNIPLDEFFRSDQNVT